ncbi:MAG: hypothetical protein C0415_03300 [Thermodesulfovibrio sp.]|nr:hypothetical protein [Thermodesulfovibrio sp.]
MAILNHRIGISITTIICVSLFLAVPASAIVVTFEKEYTYQASEIDSKVTARAIAVEQVKRLVLEELGTYLMAETEVKDFRLTKDKVVMLTAGAVQTEILNEKWDGERYYLKARIKADPTEVAASVDRLRKDTQKSKELEDMKKKADEAFKEIERLKKELEANKADTKKQKEYAKAVDKLSATDLFEKGKQYLSNEEYDKAIEAFTSAITSGEGYAPGISDAHAYNNRGLAYTKIGQHDKAIEDLTKAIALDPNLAAAYFNRGLAYYNQKQYERAIENFTKAIQLDPDDVHAYSTRAVAYNDKGLYDVAIEDFNKAIALKPNDPFVYNNRGYSYNKKRQYNKAIEDFTKAIQLNHPQPLYPYGNRGMAYWNIGDKDRAIADWRKACDFGYCKTLEWGLKNR